MISETRIDSRENERVKRVRRLTREAAARREEGLFFAEGIKLCLDLAERLPPAEVYFTAGAAEKEPRITALPGAHFQVSEGVAQKLSEGKAPQGLFCLFPQPLPWDGRLHGRSRILVLDGVQDPGNVGAALRSAAAFGWDAAVLGCGCADPFSAKALRGAMGATAKLPLMQTQELSGFLRGLAKQGCLCAAARLEDGADMHTLCPKGNFALVIGSEGRGVSAAAAAACEASVYIPIEPQMESLNAAVAAGVLMFYYRA